MSRPVTDSRDRSQPTIWFLSDHMALPIDGKLFPGYRVRHIILPYSVERVAGRGKKVLDFKRHGVEDFDFVFVCFGALDVAHAKDPCDYLASFIDLVMQEEESFDFLAVRFVSLLPIFPGGEIGGFKVKADDETRIRMTLAVNRELQSLCSKRAVPYIDVYERYEGDDMCVDGALRTAGGLVVGRAVELLLKHLL